MKDTVKCIINIECHNAKGIYSWNSWHNSASFGSNVQIGEIKKIFPIKPPVYNHTFLQGIACLEIFTHPFFINAYRLKKVYEWTNYCNLLSLYKHIVGCNFYLGDTFLFFYLLWVSGINTPITVKVSSLANSFYVCFCL